jgi:formylglycine-generating enzyme
MRTSFIFLALLICSNLYPQSSGDDMVLIPAGEFTMGKNSSSPSDWQPEHKVKLSSFYMDKHEVTNRQYYEYCIATKTPLPFFWGMKEFRSGLDFPDNPVTGVSFFEAEKYAKWSGKRLPTEAEWEYAARGGLNGNNFPLGNSADSTTINFGRKYKGTLKVGSLPANSFGLYDITGNVWEWTTDFYDPGYYAVSPSDDPKGPDRGRFKVIRGGSWHSGAMCVQTYFRNGLSPSWVDFAVGFRCIKDIK